MDARPMLFMFGAALAFVCSHALTHHYVWVGIHAASVHEILARAAQQ
jgi:hypothetical protein